MSRWTHTLISGLAGGLLLVACGGGDDSGSDGDDDTGPSASERTEMAAALGAAAANAQAAGDGLAVLVLQGAAAMLQGGLPVTAAGNVAFTLSRPVAIASSRTAANGWAFGVELGQIQGQLPNLEVGAFDGAIVISGGNIAYGFGLINATPGFNGQSFGAIWQGSDAGWTATTVTGFGVADSIIGGSCASHLPAGIGLIDCTVASLRGPGFNITASQPMNFPGNTATGSRTMAFGPNRLRGAVVSLDCGQTDLC